MPDRRHHLYKKPGSEFWHFRAVVDGRVRRCSLQTGSEAVAIKKRDKELAEIEARRAGIPRHTWKTALVEWRKDGTAALKTTTLERYLTSLNAIASILEPLWLDEINRAILHRIATRKGVTNATRRRDLTAVSSVLKAAEDRGWIDTAPSYPFRRIRERRDPIVLPTDDEIKRLHGKLSPMLSRLVRLLEQTGMRLEEAGSLKWEQCDRRRRTITLPHTKAGRTRTLELSHEAVVTLFGTPPATSTASSCSGLARTSRTATATCPGCSTTCARRPRCRGRSTTCGTSMPCAT